MPTPKICLIHALQASIPPIEEVFKEHWPNAERFNLLDDSLSADVSRDGEITDAMTQRFIDLAGYGAGTGADAILFTCSAFNRCIDAARESVNIPVLKPDEAMIEMAMDYGPRLGLLSTFGPTIASTTEQVQARAAALGVVPELQSRLVEGALSALQAGDGNTHDQLIATSLESLHGCDVIMLAQFSMARAALILETSTPILTSPGTAVAKLRGLLG